MDQPIVKKKQKKRIVAFPAAPKGRSTAPRMVREVNLTNYWHFEQLGLNDRAIVALVQHGIRTLGDLLDTPLDDLYAVPGLGKTAVRTIDRGFRRIGAPMPRVTKDKDFDAALPLKYRYAEEWLDRAVALFAPIFERAGYPLPAVRVTVGFGIKGHVQGNLRQLMGECHPHCWSVEGYNDIYITPLCQGSAYVLEVLAHELLHAVDDCQHLHTEDGFRKIARAIGHPDYCMGDTIYARGFDEMLCSFLLELGRYPRGGVRYKEYSLI